MELTLKGKKEIKNMGLLDVLILYLVMNPKSKIEDIKSFVDSSTDYDVDNIKYSYLDYRTDIFNCVQNLYSLSDKYHNQNNEYINNKLNGLTKNTINKLDGLNKSKNDKELINFNNVFKYSFEPILSKNIPVTIHWGSKPFKIIKVTPKSLVFETSTGKSGPTYKLSIGTVKEIYNKGVNDIILTGNKRYFDGVLDFLLKKEKELKTKEDILDVNDLDDRIKSRLNKIRQILEKSKKSHLFDGFINWIEKIKFKSSLSLEKCDDLIRLVLDKIIESEEVDIYCANHHTDISHDSILNDPLHNIGTDSNLYGRSEILFSFRVKNYIPTLNQSNYDAYYANTNEKEEIKDYSNDIDPYIKFGKITSYMNYDYSFYIIDLCDSLRRNPEVFHNYSKNSKNLKKYIEYFINERYNNQKGPLFGEVCGEDIVKFDDMILEMAIMYDEGYDFGDIECDKFFRYLVKDLDLLEKAKTDLNNNRPVSEDINLTIISKTHMYYNPRLISTTVTQGKLKWKIHPDDLVK